MVEKEKGDTPNVFPKIKNEAQEHNLQATSPT